MMEVILIALAACLVNSTSVAVDLSLGGRARVGHGRVAFAWTGVAERRHILLFCVSVASILADILLVDSSREEFLARSRADLGSHVILAGSYLSQPLVEVVFTVLRNVLVDLGFAWVGRLQPLGCLEAPSGLSFVDVAPPLRVDQWIESS